MARPSKWTLESVTDIAKKYETLKDFREHEDAAYRAAMYHGWLDGLKQRLPVSESGRKRVNEDSIRKALTGRNIELVRYAGSMGAQSVFRCLIHDFMWETTSDSVVRGTGCSICGGKHQIDEQQLRDRLQHMKVELIHYAGNMKGLSTFKCTVDGCGHTWSTSASSVLSSKHNGCRKCAGRLPWAKSDVLAAIVGRNIDLVNYSGDMRQTRSRFKCTVCGYEWETVAGSVVDGCGCRICNIGGFKETKPAIFYIYKIFKEGEVFLGFGVTNDFKVRRTKHARSFVKHNARGNLLRTFQMAGAQAATYEKAVKLTYRIVNTGIPGFITEAVMFSDSVFAAMCDGAERFAISTQTR